MFDLFSFFMGLVKGRKQGAKNVTLEGDDYEYTDSNTDGHIVITEVNN